MASSFVSRRHIRGPGGSQLLAGASKTPGYSSTLTPRPGGSQNTWFRDQEHKCESAATLRVEMNSYGFPGGAGATPG